MKELFWRSIVTITDGEENCVNFDDLEDEDCAKIADAIRRGFDCGKIKVDY